MVGCCAIGCSNRSEQGFLMRYFPKDPNRRKLWILKVKRAHWTPTDRSVLCEKHFEPSMWEKDRVDGKRKLKQNAFPTLFSFVTTTKIRKTNKERIFMMESTFDSPPHVPLVDKKEPGSSSEIDVSMDVPIDFSSDSDTSQCSIESLDSTSKKDISLLQKKLKQYDREYKKLLIETRNYKKQLRSMKRQLKNLQTMHELCGKNKMIKEVFNEDQTKYNDRSTGINVCVWNTHYV